VILVDSSVWVEYDRATGSPAHVRLREAELRRLLMRFRLVRFDTVTDFNGAVRIYRICRAAGVIPRGMIDCMIAAVAWRTRATLLAHDADLDRVARVIEIELDHASLRA
jgi:predicted nucleic acid-binding protein